MGDPRLNRRLVLQTRDRLPDGAGGFAETWVSLGTLWAEIASASGREVAGPTGALSRLRLKITLRAAPQGAPSRPVPGQRFKEGARAYNILAVADPDPEGRFLTCYATEEAAT